MPALNSGERPLQIKEAVNPVCQLTLISARSDSACLQYDCWTVIIHWLLAHGWSGNKYKRIQVYFAVNYNLLGAKWTLRCLMPGLGFDGLPMLMASSLTPMTCRSGELESLNSLEV